MCEEGKVPTPSFTVTTHVPSSVWESSDIERLYKHLPPGDWVTHIILAKSQSLTHGAMHFLSQLEAFARAMVCLSAQGISKKREAKMLKWFCIDMQGQSSRP